MNAITGKVRTFELVVNVDGFMEGELEDWPANIQDAIYMALEKKAQEVELPLTITGSKCDQDPDTHTFFIVVYASEIVVALPPAHKRH